MPVPRRSPRTRRSRREALLAPVPVAPALAPPALVLTPPALVLAGLALTLAALTLAVLAAPALAASVPAAPVTSTSATSTSATPPAGAAKPHGTTYLALGDSLAFGYSQARFDRLEAAGEPAQAYRTGYVDDFGHTLGRFQPGVRTVNDGCPGETTDSLIAGPCVYGLAFPLHHPYAGGPLSSQLSDALDVIAADPSVTPITLDIGANDALGVIEGVCKLDAKCIAEHAPALFAHVAGNLGLILADLRGADPQAKIVVLGLYNPFGETIPGADALTAKLNEVEAAVAAGAGAKFADPLPVFNPPGAQEQPTLCALTNICTPLHDIHPTNLGYDVLGQLIAAQYASL